MPSKKIILQNLGFRICPTKFLELIHEEDSEPIILAKSANIVHRLKISVRSFRESTQSITFFDKRQFQK